MRNRKPKLRKHFENFGGSHKFERASKTPILFWLRLLQPLCFSCGYCLSTFLETLSGWDLSSPISCCNWTNVCITSRQDLLGFKLPFFFFCFLFGLRLLCMQESLVRQTLGQHSLVVSVTSGDASVYRHFALEETWLDFHYPVLSASCGRKRSCFQAFLGWA